LFDFVVDVSLVLQEVIWIVLLSLIWIIDVHAVLPDVVNSTLNHPGLSYVLAEGIVASDLTFRGDLWVIDAHLELGIVAKVLTQVIFVSSLMLRVGCRNTSRLTMVPILLARHLLIVVIHRWLQRLLFLLLRI
jgi:hypothetical protein